MLLQDGFETWSGGYPDGWFSIGAGTVTQDGVEQHGGSWCAKLTGTSAGYLPFMQKDMVVDLTPYEGQPLVFSFFGKALSGSYAVEIWANRIGDGGIFLTYSQISNSEWVEHAWSGVVPAGVEKLLITVYSEHIGEVVGYVDDMEVTVTGESKIDLINDFRTELLILSNIASKFSMAIEVVKNISSRFHLAKAKIYNAINDIRIHKKEIDNISNDFRMIASWQIPGDTGVLALGKSAFILKINGIDKTSILDLDSLRWRETLNSSATASFTLAIPYDSASCPSEGQSIEILFDNRRKFYGHITNITKLSSPEGVAITAEDEYWNLNKTTVDFKVGRKIEGDPVTYYDTISEALSACGFGAGVGGFIPEVISCVGSKADVISQLVRESGNFGWFIKPNGTKKLWQADKGDIVTLEKQEIGKNLGLYQIMNHDIVEDSSGVVNKLKVIMGEDILPGYNNEFRFAYISQKYEQYNSNWMAFYRNNEPFGENERDYYSSIAWYNRGTDTAQQVFEAYIDAPSDVGGNKFKITVPPGMVAGYPLEYKPTVNPFGGAYWLPAWAVSWEKDHLSENTGVSYSYPVWYSRGGIYPEGRRERVFYVAMGSYPQTIQKDLILSGLNVQYGRNYKMWEGHNWSSSSEFEEWRKWDEMYEGIKEDPCNVTRNQTGGYVTEKPYKIPSWNDIAYATDYANWQISKICDIKKRGTIRITMDCADFYGLDLSKRIKIPGIIDGPVNIVSIDYDVGNYLVTINVESFRYYARSVNIPIHSREE